MKQKFFSITLKKSLIGRIKKHQECAKGLGLKKINQTVRRIDTQANRGMANKINYMITIQEE